MSAMGTDTARRPDARRDHLAPPRAEPAASHYSQDTLGPTSHPAVVRAIRVACARHELLRPKERPPLIVRDGTRLALDLAVEAPEVGRLALLLVAPVAPTADLLVDRGRPAPAGDLAIYRTLREPSPATPNLHVCLLGTRTFIATQCAVTVG
jgi:hypothetical protein